MRLASTSKSPSHNRPHREPEDRRPICEIPSTIISNMMANLPPDLLYLRQIIKFKRINLHHIRDLIPVSWVRLPDRELAYAYGFFLFTDSRVAMGGGRNLFGFELRSVVAEDIVGSPYKLYPTNISSVTEFDQPRTRKRLWLGTCCVPFEN
ncbi:uncharacterized protein LACBIDRAFT_330293 [Laccaria bicolor S238N-H82]|uniref:Predicted protein n=1 Tax=Laccaria bicolor (strain S238N-H82 / ATCC MYA-4686) TaxID=486041 RepID=B0DKU2_LACBS|nr:uncharacterized protein LACBIDRAFT_330293 [Laccaria bicolor S238N-H82]EDR04707.1 predicted protein [Laccaria bicolor S238N-H82]|eukprot:XP_001884531.1 predicted protein [Laccaria bicolor S238N-H82]